MYSSAKQMLWSRQEQVKPKKVRDQCSSKLLKRRIKREQKLFRTRTYEFLDDCQDEDQNFNEQTGSESDDDQQDYADDEADQEYDYQTYSNNNSNQKNTFGSLQFISKQKQFHTKSLQKAQSIEKEQEGLDQYSPINLKSNKECEPQLTQLPQTVQLLCVTWNQMGIAQEPHTLHDLQPILKGHHIISVSTQECGRSILKSMLMSSKQQWEQDLQETVGSDYVLLKSISQNALHLVVFLHHTLIPYVSHLAVGQQSTGVANIVFNKGALSIAFMLNNTSFLFVNCHLASGQAHSNKRLKDFEQIERGTLLKKCHKYDHQLMSNRFDAVIWNGDLNFRIDLDYDQVIKMLEEKQIEKLLENDQLKKLKKNSILEDFQEGTIKFPPTYKLALHSHHYSPKGNKTRIPSWTDRILFKSKGNRLILDNYESLRNVLTSDHRPVFAQFNYQLS